MSKEKRWCNIDKETWGPGEWQDEPDIALFTDEATGYRCVMVRAPLGYWLGYVELEPGHPLYGEGELDGLLSVHGGITYNECRHPDWHKGSSYTIGFDCMHAFDHAPGKIRSGGKEWSVPNIAGVYRNYQYVRDEIRELCRQLGEIASNRDAGSGR